MKTANTAKHDACQGDPARPILPSPLIMPGSTRKGTVRASKMGRRRAFVLLAVHVVVFLHILHWKLTGTTLSPVEPSEAMYTITQGAVHAGALLLVLAILATLVLGRWFCGWACHLVALQDACGWIMKKVGIRPQPLRSRLLMWVPLVAGLYMLVISPIGGRVAAKLGPPELRLALTKTEFWETFPGPLIATLTFAVCGFGLIYLLGSKGFCTYACPYGGFFGVADRFAPGRIRVTDACKACGHCTTVCTSNVVVDREVHEYGMVVDPGCMKCGDCISSCPEQALYFGFGKPAAFAKPRRSVKPRARALVTREELALGMLFALALVIFTGLPHFLFPWATSLYGGTPLLLGLALSGATAFIGLTLRRLRRRQDLSLQNLVLKRGDELTGAGRTALVIGAAWILFLVVAGVTQALTFSANRMSARIDLATLAWRDRARTPLSRDDAAAIERATSFATMADALSLGLDPRHPRQLAALAQARGDTHEAIAQMRRAVDSSPKFAYAVRDLGLLLQAAGEPVEAADHFARALALDPHNHEFLAAAERALQAFIAAGRPADAARLYRRIIETDDKNPKLWRDLATCLLLDGDAEGTAAALGRAAELDPRNPEPLLALAEVMDATGRADDAAALRARAAALRP
jgi:polyferredoxin/tetratricopeptide (TPR) repeat protein